MYNNNNNDSKINELNEELKIEREKYIMLLKEKEENENYYENEIKNLKKLIENFTLLNSNLQNKLNV